MKTVHFAVAALLVVVLASGCVNPAGGRPRRFPGNMTPRGNMSFEPFELSEENITRVTEVFESAESNEALSAYCSVNRMLCGYYCRSINPEHEFCSELRLNQRRFLE